MAGDYTPFKYTPDALGSVTDKLNGSFCFGAPQPSRSVRKTPYRDSLRLNAPSTQLTATETWAFENDLRGKTTQGVQAPAQTVRLPNHLAGRAAY